MKKLNLITVKLLLATYADMLQDINDEDPDRMERRLKEVDEFLELQEPVISLLDILVEGEEDVEA